MTPALALGTAQLTRAYGVATQRAGEVDQRASTELLRAALALGIRELDAAPGYGDAEARVGAFADTERFEVTTKLPSLPAGLGVADVRAAVHDALTGSLSRLGRSRVDAYLIHATADLARYGAALVDALEAEVRAGRIGHAGVSVYGPEDAEVALSFPALRVIQYPFNVFDGAMVTHGLTARLRAQGVRLVARSALLQGLFTLRADALPPRMASAEPFVRALDSLCVRYDVAPHAAALAYAAARSDADVLLVGAESAAQLTESATLARAEVPGALLEALDEAFADVPAAVRDPRAWSAA